jgi:hypothetical protein
MCLLGSLQGSLINLGNPSRMLATAEPRTEDILPIDDMAWELGVCNATTQIFRV